MRAAAAARRGVAKLRGLARDESGAFAAMFAVMFPVILGIGALGIETGIWYTLKRHDQSVADVAAVSAATEIMNSGSCTSGTGPGVYTSCPPAANIAYANGFDLNRAANAASALTFPYTGGGCAATPNSCVRVVLQHQQTPMLASLVLPSLNIANQSIAQIQSQSNTCAFAFGANENGKGLDLTGTTGFTQPNCQLATNSTSPGSVQLSGNSDLSLYSIYSTGGIDIDGNPDLTLTVAPRLFQATAIDDPYASVAVATTPADLTTFAMPTVASSVSVPRPPNAPNPAAVTAAPVSQPGSGCDATSTVITTISANCYLSLSGVEITGGTFASGAYFFAGPVTISGPVSVSSGVAIQVTTGDFTVTAAGSLTFADNNNGVGANGPATILVAAGNFDASAGSVTFVGDTSNNAGYAIQVPPTGTVSFGTAGFSGGKYAFYGGGLVLGAGSNTTTLGAAQYRVATGNVTVNSGGTARFTLDPAAVPNSASSKTTNLEISNGSFASNGTITFNDADATGASYALEVLTGQSFAFNGPTTFGAASGDQKGYGFYGGGVTIGSAATATLRTVNFYVDAGGLAISGPTTLAATTAGDCTTAGNCTTITVKAGTLTASSNLTFTGSASSQYNICFGSISNQNGCNGSTSGQVVLSGTTSFGPGLYYFLNGSNNAQADAIRLNGGTATFAPATYSVQKGNFSVASGATGTFTAASGGNTACAPTGNATCLKLASGSVTNSGTLTLGSTGSNTFYINSPLGTFVNNSSGTLNFGSGSYYIYDENGNNDGGFANFGTMTLCGSSAGTGCSATASDYYFFNGPSQGTNGPDSGKCDNSTTVFGALSLMGGSTTTFGPGNYYLVNGDLCMNQDNGTAPIVHCSGCTVGADGMTFILTGTGTGSTRENNISSLQILNPIDTSSAPLSAPGSGTYQGLLVYQDRNAPLDDYNGLEGSCGINCNTIEGGASMDLTGAIYMPKAELDFRGNNTASSGQCLVLLVDSLRFTGNAALDTEGCAAAGVNTVTIKNVALIQ